MMNKVKIATINTPIRSAMKSMRMSLIIYLRPIRLLGFIASGNIVAELAPSTSCPCAGQFSSRVSPFSSTHRCFGGLEFWLKIPRSFGQVQTCSGRFLDTHCLVSIRVTLIGLGKSTIYTLAVDDLCFVILPFPTMSLDA